MNAIIDKIYTLFIKKAALKAERYKKCGKQEMGVFDIFPFRGKLQDCKRNRY